MPSLFVDTWGWVVLADGDAAEHDAVDTLYRAVRSERGRIITTDYILDELITFLFKKVPVASATQYLKGLFASIARGHIQTEPISRERFHHAWEMRLKYSDHPDISFTDITSFIVMRELGVTRVLTNDRHFEQVNLGFRRITSS